MALTGGSFRPDINGLRAWAVVAVALYHFGVLGFQGGFVGVDIFFVISGFLMTSIIVGKIERENFSVTGFYVERARRILPALFVCCGVLLTIGWFFLGPAGYRQLGQHVATALGFVSNIKFWLEGGYFDGTTQEKWLLHTWSLSVEWQFYMLLPLALVLIWRLWPSRRAIITCLVAAFLASLTISLLLTPFSPQAAFYLLPSRAWEMLAGSLVFLLPLHAATSVSTRRGIEFVGLALILVAVGLTDHSTQWPGWRALIPVVGTMLVLLAARSDSLWTGTRLCQWLGDISYSLYLWHWPVVVALAYLEIQSNTLAIGLGIVASVLLGYLSWRWIEQPSRRWLAELQMKPSVVVLSTLALALMLPSALIYLKNGVPGRFNAHIEQVFAEARNTNPLRKRCLGTQAHEPPECIYGGRELGAIVVGDSHAATVVRTIERAMERPDRHVLDWTYAGCPTLEGVKRLHDEGCGRFISTILEKQKSLDAVPVIILSRTSNMAFGPNEIGREDEFGKPSIYFDVPSEAPTPEFLAQFRERLIGAACQFAERHPTFLVRPIPEMRKDVPRTMGRRLLVDEDGTLDAKERVSISLDKYHARHRFVWEAQNAAQAQCGVRILNPLPYLCHEGRCWADKDGLPLYLDDDHLSERGAALLLPMFQSAFRPKLTDDMVRVRAP